MPNATVSPGAGKNFQTSQPRGDSQGIGRFRFPHTDAGAVIPSTMNDWHYVLGAIAIVAEVIGVIFALRAILISRTPQAAIGWVVALIMLPYVAIPLFLVFGESRFSGYKQAGHGESPELDALLTATREKLLPFQAAIPDRLGDVVRINERLTGLPATTGNAAQLLIDGAATFRAIGDAIDRAHQSIIFQFFILRDDGLGREMQARLLAALGRGVAVYVLYDQVGSRTLPAAYVETLRSAGAQVRCFETNRQRGKRFRINFRNHRKLVVVDGAVAFVGGQNVGDEYLGLSKRFGPWRDTFVQVVGPVTQALAIPFAEDWQFTTKAVPKIHESVEPTAAGEARMFIVPSGPAPIWNVCPATYTEIIRSAKKRLWLASPYLIPDQALRSAIGHASLRGVDVRLLLPKNPDHLLPWLSSFTFYPALRTAGVRVFRYQKGFMHQKVVLADDDIAVVGSINLDYRSFMLNFELSVGVIDAAFARSVEEMFLTDFSVSEEDDLWAFERGSLAFRLKCRAAALLSPQQ